MWSVKFPSFHQSTASTPLQQRGLLRASPSHQGRFAGLEDKTSERLSVAHPQEQGHGGQRKEKFEKKQRGPDMPKVLNSGRKWRTKVMICQPILTSQRTAVQEGAGGRKQQSKPKNTQPTLLG